MAIVHGHWRVAAGILGFGTILTICACAEKSAPQAPTIASGTCPQWVAFPRDHHSNADSPYLGCTSAGNLRAMVANPVDLERGQPLGPSNGQREVLGIEAYEEGKIKPFQGTGPRNRVRLLLRWGGPVKT